MERPIRVLQAADLNLHEPLVSVGKLPPPQQEIYQQARELAAIRLFDAAISRNADVLLLTGTLTSFEQEPRLACFLLEQFRRLTDAGVQILWAAGGAGSLPAWLLDPSLIRIVRPGEWVSCSTRDGHHSIRVHHSSQGELTSHASNGRAESHHDVVITILNTSVGQTVSCKTPQSTERKQYDIIPLHHSSPESTGASGFMVMDFHQNGRIEVDRVCCPVVDWTTETVDVNPHQTRSSLIQEIGRRLEAHRSRMQAKLLCVNWVLAGCGPVWEELLTQETTPLLQEIRGLTQSDSRIWSARLEYDPAEEQLQEWKESWPFAEATNQLDHLGEGDLQAASATPHLAGHVMRSDNGEFMNHRVLSRCRWRIARDLRPTVTAHHRFEH